ncbi:nucleoside ABC transporter membrane protein [Actinocorallia herbida]|uniref:Nucleoside ABC transporter membrane protein n=1 Tax=Actinocorallia herbida TaxID=58109 RepID=A0A3N1CTJ8_9ACTN|nr:ABC transporter permease [Actinocorallia herbida]ROO84545.1 nucleoside ABC transporter membrane protein [Actinocorallia herbida]
MSAFAELVDGGVRLAIPLLIASAGELVSERAGVLNMSVEGMMLTGAFAGAVGAHTTGSASAGLVCALVAGVLVAAIQALLSVTLRADQIVTGVAANALALGATTYGARLYFTEGRTVPGFDPIAIPLLSDIPVIGPALFDLTFVGYLCVVVAVVLAVLFGKRSGFGLAVTAIGADAETADRSGLPVNAVRFGAVLLAGLTSALAGAHLVLADVHAFTDNVTAGAGYLAVAAVIAGRWKAWPTLIACLFFGLAQALQFAAPAFGIELPTAVLVMSPYLLALIAVSGLVGASRSPAGLTLPFLREARA